MAEFKRYLMNKNQKPSTINRAVISLSAFFEWLNIPNPAKEIKLLPEVKTAPQALDRKGTSLPDQVCQVFREAEGHCHRYFAAAHQHKGLRALRPYP